MEGIINRSNDLLFSPEKFSLKISTAVQGSTFKEVLKDIKNQMDETILKIAGPDEIIDLFGITVDKNSAAAAFLINHKFNEFQELVTISMNIINILKDIDKSLSQAMSR